MQEIQEVQIKFQAESVKIQTSVETYINSKIWLLGGPKVHWNKWKGIYRIF
jgi:hypothetical protein